MPVPVIMTVTVTFTLIDGERHMIKPSLAASPHRPEMNITPMIDVLLVLLVDLHGRAAVVAARPRRQSARRKPPPAHVAASIDRRTIMVEYFADKRLEI